MGRAIKRRLLAITLTFMMVFGLSINMASAKTITNPDTIKVGLTSLQSTSLNLTLEGHYKVNGTPVADKQLSFAISGNKILYNGSSYDEITLEPSVSSARILANYSGKTNRYPGVVLLKVSSGKILPVNYVDMQSYLKGVLPYEISNSYPIEAIKAQAVTSRTFALANLNKHLSQGINVCDTTNCQVYRGENSSYQNISKAVDETKNMVLTFNGSLASVTFGASNGGYIESSLNIWGSNYSYLPAKEDKYDKDKWPDNKTYTTSELDKLFKSKGHLSSTDKLIAIGEVVKNSSARVAEMELTYSDKNGSKHSKVLKKEEPRWALGLRSMLFDVNYNKQKDVYTFSGKGYGHGVGMSQIGAKARAADGQKYNEILGFYFQGTTIQAIGTTAGETPNLPPTNSGSGGNDSPNVSDKPQDAIVAKSGTRGTVVTNLQANLNYLGYSAGTADGIFGKNTENAVKSFQGKEGLSKTGVVYESTNKLINQRSGEKKTEVSKPSTTPSNDKVLAQKGNRSDLVKEIQNNLNYLGYSAGGADGIFGNNTVNAVKSFQKANGLSQTGIVYESTRSLILNKVNDKKSNTTASKVIAQSGSKGQVVKNIQTALNKLGYNSGTADGIFGKNTINAVKAFQKAKGLTQTGIVDQVTYKALI